MKPEINAVRLMGRIVDMAKTGALESGGVTRLTLTKEDKAARDLLVRWMQELGLEVRIDKIGNIFGIRKGRQDGAPVMTGSHLDSVIRAGRLDGPYGILAGLEVVAALNDAGVETEKPIAVANFTNEEGVRFHPDMMGSLVYAGGCSVDEILAVEDRDGVKLGDALSDIGYAGDMTPGAIRPSAFIELHIEQGPTLESENLDIGIVEDLTGISWQEITITGTANHAGTTPMHLRKDAGVAAARIVTFVNALAEDLGPSQRGTVGSLNLTPNAVNVVPGKAILTVDLRNPDNDALKRAEHGLANFLKDLGNEGFEIETRRLVRFDPVDFDQDVVAAIERNSEALGLSWRRMTSGAGHDAQMMARICPAAMIFVPSRGGISHNPKEFTEEANLIKGASALLHTIFDLAR